ncbi:MAG: WHG domain-containing protein [Ruminiclostridium sp.]|nr:WHG domain-containing protein [Ruminiclostridium sp.]
MAVREKITRKTIVDAGFEIVREQGIEKLNVRGVAARIGCSTQPVMYCYHTADEMKADILERANEYHTEYLARRSADDTDVLIAIGMNYIRFAAEERNLFRFIFLSDMAQNAGITELISADDSAVVPILAGKYGMSAENAKDTFEALFGAFHGYAAMIAYGMISYDEAHCRKQLNRICGGLAKQIRQEEQQTAKI